MLNLEELRMLRWLTSSYYAGQGAIIDGGCFLGGSTISLAEGLRDSGRADKIDTYDLFIADEESASFYGNGQFVAGGSFRAQFDANVRPYVDLLTIHAGDIRRDPWNGGPIEIFFVDIAKTVSINDMLVSSFLTSLIPNRSIVVTTGLLASVSSLDPHNDGKVIGSFCLSRRYWFQQRSVRC